MAGEHIRKSEARAMSLQQAVSKMRGFIQHVESPMTMSTERRKLHHGRRCCRRIDDRACSYASPRSANQQTGGKAMPYQAKPMPFDPKSISGISEKVLVSHYENNYVGAVKRLNAIGTQLAELDFAKVPNFVING